MSIIWRTAKDRGMDKLHAVKRGEGGLSHEAVCGFKPFTGWWPKHHHKSACRECVKLVGKEEA